LSFAFVKRSPDETQWNPGYTAPVATLAKLSVVASGDAMVDELVKYAQILSAVATTIGLASLFLIYKQLRDARAWNRLHFTYTFFPDSQEFEELEIFLDRRLKFWLREPPLSNLEVKAMIGRESLSEIEKDELCQRFDKSVKKENCEQELIEAGRKLKIYLNQIEYYCAAVSSGIVDSDSAKNIYCYKFKRAYEKALPWISEIRRQRNEPSIFIEMTKTLNAWFPPPEGEKNKY
jgi:hypothetical protein